MELERGTLYCYNVLLWNTILKLPYGMGPILRVACLEQTPGVNQSPDCQHQKLKIRVNSRISSFPLAQPTNSTVYTVYAWVRLFVCVRASACTTRTQQHQQYANIQHYL